MTQRQHDVWKAAEQAVIAGDVSTLEQLLREHPQMFGNDWPPPYVPSGPHPRYADAEARAIIAREHHFDSFTQFAEHVGALKRQDSPVSLFESAVDAVIAGDVAMLARMLRATVDWEWIAHPNREGLDEKVRADSRMLAALGGRA